MTRLRLALGLVWIVVPLAFLAFDMYQETQRAFVSWTYYFALWGGLAVLALSGLYFLLAMPKATAVLRTTAVLVALYTSLGIAITVSNAPFYGGIDWFALSIPLGIVAFSIFSVLVAGRSAT
jgi:hypothetical protein